jgi:hypothetical protein
MKKVLLLMGVLTLLACQKKEFLEPEVSKSSIEKNAKAEDLSFPFATEEELSFFKSNPKVLHYEKARKVALLEMQLTNYIEEMNWNGFHLSEKPIVIYDLASVPKYYDYIALDSENEPIGTVRVTATKEKNTVLQSLFSKTFNYNEMLSKSSVTHPSFFIDWKGTEFVGQKSKSGEAPMQLIATESGNLIPQSEVKEPNNQEIIDALVNEVFSDFYTKDEKIAQQLQLQGIEKINVNGVRDSLQRSLLESEEGAAAFWKDIDEVEGELLQTSDEEIVNTNSKFFGRIRRWFSRKILKTDETPYIIHKYNEKRYSYREFARGKDWCGPWVCGYIFYVKESKDEYDWFVQCASSYGELGFLNLGLRKFGRPMTPAEMNWSMALISKRNIYIDNRNLCFKDSAVYLHIKNSNKPAIRLCGVAGELHWTLAYGAKKTGPVVWRKYEFRQIDNGAKIKDREAFTSTEWWNIWLGVWD